MGEKFIGRLVRALTRLCLGALLGLLLLELILRVNTRLLPAGMEVPSPAMARSSIMSYPVRLSDADIFYWTPELVRLPAEQPDAVEAQVELRTDLYGFPNPAPFYEQVDLVILGRSFSIGAQAARPWPQLLAAKTGWQVLNLSQTGSSIDTKLESLKRYGLPHQPQWVIVTLIPSLDILEYRAPPSLLISRLPYPLLRRLALGVQPPPLPGEDRSPIYPLELQIPGRSVEVVFYHPYLEALTVSEEQWRASAAWQELTVRIGEMAATVSRAGACLALMLIPTRESVYLPLSSEPRQLGPAGRLIGSWELNPSGAFYRSSAPPSIEALQRQAVSILAPLAELADELDLVLIDPHPLFRTAVLAGGSPFMRYDTHWSALGHQLIAAETANVLLSAGCRR